MPTLNIIIASARGGARGAAIETRMQCLSRGGPGLASRVRTSVPGNDLPTPSDRAPKYLVHSETHWAVQLSGTALGGGSQQEPLLNADNGATVTATGDQNTISVAPSNNPQPSAREQRISKIIRHHGRTCRRSRILQLLHHYIEHGVVHCGARLRLANIYIPIGAARIGHGHTVVRYHWVPARVVVIQVPLKRSGPAATHLREPRPPLSCPVCFRMRLALFRVVGFRARPCEHVDTRRRTRGAA